MDRAGAALFLSMMVGAVGMALIVYGRKQRRLPHAAAGVALVAYPYFVDSPWVMLGIANAIVGLMAVAIRLGL